MATKGTFGQGTLANIPSDGLVTAQDLQELIAKCKDEFPTKAQTVTSLAATANAASITYTKVNGSTGTFTPNNAIATGQTNAHAGYMSADDKKKLDGIATGANAYSLPLAASGTRGGVQVGYGTTGKTYAVQLSSEKMYVSVPWTDTSMRGISNALNNTWTNVSLAAAAGKWLYDNKQASGSYAAASHTHNYAASNHTHNYAAASHTHAYAASNHNHDSSYAAKSHSHSYIESNRKDKGHPIGIISAQELNNGDYRIFFYGNDTSRWYWLDFNRQ